MNRFAKILVAILFLIAWAAVATAQLPTRRAVHTEPLNGWTARADLLDSLLAAADSAIRADSTELFACLFGDVARRELTVVAASEVGPRCASPRFAGSLHTHSLTTEPSARCGPSLDDLANFVGDARHGLMVILCANRVGYELWRDGRWRWFNWAVR